MWGRGRVWRVGCGGEEGSGDLGLGERGNGRITGVLSEFKHIFKSNDILYRNTKQETIAQTIQRRHLDLSGIALEETRKNSPINISM